MGGATGLKGQVKSQGSLSTGELRWIDLYRVDGIISITRPPDAPPLFSLTPNNLEIVSVGHFSHCFDIRMSLEQSTYQDSIKIAYPVFVK